MTCSKCKQSACCCTVSTIGTETTTCTTEKNCLGEQDICFGFGESKQIRNGRKVTVDKINCHTIPCPDGKSVGEHLSKAHMHYDSVEDTFIEITTPDDTIVQYAKKLKVGDTIVVDGCAYENIKVDNQTRPGTEQEEGWNRLCKPEELEESEGCPGNKILVFNSCDDLVAYAGTEACPLVDGMIARVQNENGCYEDYMGKWFIDNANADNDNDACGKWLTHHPEGGNKEFRWIAYSECHPEVFVTDNKLTIDGSTITSTVTRNDGTVLSDAVTIPIPPDNHATSLTIANNTVTIGRNNGLPNLTAPLPVVPPPKSFIKQVHIKNNATTVYGTRVQNIGTIFTAPYKGKYQLSGNYSMELDCPSGSFNMYYRWGYRIYVNGSPKIAVDLGGFAGHYKSLGQMYGQSCGVGGVLALNAGDVVTLWKSEGVAQNFKNPDRAEVKADIGVAYVGE